MTAEAHIFLMSHYHSEIASVLLPASMWLHLGKSFIQSIRLLSRVEIPLFGLKALSVGYFKRDEEEFKNIRYTV